MFAMFKKRQNVFVKLIHDQAAATLAGMEALLAFLSDPNQAAADRLTKTEKDGDEFRRGNEDGNDPVVEFVFRAFRPDLEAAEDEFRHEFAQYKETSENQKCYNDAAYIDAEKAVRPYLLDLLP